MLEGTNDRAYLFSTNVSLPVKLSSMNNDSARLHQLESQLKLVTENFEREMRARGFDPAQAENAALPAPLARLFIERQSLVEEIEEIRKGNKQ